MALNYTESIQPRDLADYDGPLFVKANSRTLMSFDDLKGNLLTLRNGEIAILDHAIARNPGFQKFWRSGKVFVFKDDPAIDDEMTEQELRIRAAAEKRDLENSVKLEAMDGSTDLSSDECLECKTPVFQTQEDRYVVPPLCADHEDHSEMWAFHQYLDEDTGDIKRQWKPVKIER